MAIHKAVGYPGDQDTTIVIPKPGGRGRVPFAAPPLPPVSAETRSHEQLAVTGVNPLVSAATSLLILSTHLRDRIAHQDIVSLRQHILAEIKAFENEARAHGIDRDIVYTCRYVLCTLLDETVLNTVWGSNSTWGNKSLLSTLYNERLGGERFFVILNELLRDPDANLDLLELMYICVSLGLKGQYRVIARGQEKLDELRTSVFEHIRRRRGEFTLELSPTWDAGTHRGGALQRYVPLWVLFAVAGALLLTIFMGFTVVLENTVEPAYEALGRMGNPVVGEFQPKE